MHQLVENSPLTRGGSYIRTILADQWDFVKVLQEEIGFMAKVVLVV